MNHIIDNNNQPLGFFSKKLIESQQKWSAYSRELLAIYKGVKDIIKGRQLVIYTDHKSITSAFKQKPKKKNRSTSSTTATIYKSVYNEYSIYKGYRTMLFSTFFHKPMIVLHIDYKTLAESQRNEKKLINITKTDLKFVQLKIPNTKFKIPNKIQKNSF